MVGRKVWRFYFEFCVYVNSKSREIFIKDTEWYIRHSSLADCTNIKVLCDIFVLWCNIWKYIYWITINIVLQYVVEYVHFLFYFLCNLPFLCETSWIQIGYMNAVCSVSFMVCVVSCVFLMIFCKIVLGCCAVSYCFGFTAPRFAHRFLVSFFVLHYIVL